MIKIRTIEIPGLHRYVVDSNGIIYVNQLVGDELILKRIKCLKTDTGFVVRLSVAAADPYKVNLPLDYLVCGTFHGFYRGFEQVRHIDSNVFNNHSSNLMWAVKKKHEPSIRARLQGVEIL